VSDPLLLDHAIVLVRDLPAAEATLVQAGFTLGRAGAHPGLGTHNRVVLFAEGPYLELLAVQRSDAANAHYQAMLADAPCVLGLALASADIAATADRLARAGLSARPALQASRPVPGHGGGIERLARFSLLPLPPGALPVAFAFHCQHHDPALVWEPAPAHPNGVQALRRVAAPGQLLVSPCSDSLAPAGTRAGWVQLQLTADGQAALHFDTGVALRCTAAGLQAVAPTP
jgi:hypothetical protein